MVWWKLPSYNTGAMSLDTFLILYKVELGTGPLGKIIDVTAHAMKAM